MIKIGSNKSIWPLRYYTYRDCKSDNDGWVKAKEFMPKDYDLCDLKLADGTIKRGWSTGVVFDGMRIKEGDIVTHWRAD